MTVFRDGDEFCSGEAKMSDRESFRHIIMSSHYHV